MLLSNKVKLSAAVLVISTFLTQPAFSAEVKKSNKKATAKKVEQTQQKTAAKAESSTKEDITKFDTVTVVASKNAQKAFTFPAQVSVIDYTKNQATSNSTRISNIQQSVAGLNFYGGPRATAETPQMRGFTQKDVIVTVDGRKQNFDSVHDGRFFVDPQLIKKVEVVKGPSSALYGSGGLGGVVAFETKDAKDVVAAGKKIGGESSVGFNSANTQVLTSQIAGMVGDNYDALAAFSGSKSDDIALSNGATSKDDERILSGLAKLTYNLNDVTTLKLDASTFQGEGQTPNNPQAGPADTSAVNKVDRTNIVNSAGVKLGYNPSDLVNLNTHLYFTSTEVNERVLSSSSLNLAGSELDNQTDTIGLNIDNSSKLGEFAGANHTFTYGVEYVNNDMTGKDSARAFRFGVPSAESTQMGAFVQDELKFAGFTGEQSSFYVIPAARFDKFENEANDSTLPSQEKSHISPKIAATYEFNKNYNIFSSYGQAFRAPTLTELYISGTHFPAGGPGVNNVFVANPFLKPETATTFEYGFGTSFDSVIKNSDKVSLKVSRFETKAEDYIDQQINFNPFTGGTTGFVNVDEARIWGYEGELKYLTDAFRAQLTASYVTGKNQTTGAYLGTNDALKFKTDVAYTLPSTNVELGYLGKYAAGFDKAYSSSFGALDQVNFARGGYAVHGVYTQYKAEGALSGFTFNVGVDNIFDKAYADTQARNYEIGRSIGTRVTYKW